MPLIEHDVRPISNYTKLIDILIKSKMNKIYAYIVKKDCCLQIIRTTYWTRFDDRLRYDEKLECQQTNDSYRLKDIKNGIYYEREVMVFSDTEIPNGNGHAGDEVHSGNGCVTEALANGDVENKSELKSSFLVEIKSCYKENVNFLSIILNDYNHK